MTPSDDACIVKLQLRGMWERRVGDSAIFSTIKAIKAETSTWQRLRMDGCVAR